MAAVCVVVGLMLVLSTGMDSLAALYVMNMLRDLSCDGMIIFSTM